MFAVRGGPSSAFFCAAQSGLHLLHLLLQQLFFLSHLLVSAPQEELHQRAAACLKRWARLRAAYILAWVRSSSFSSASFWLLSSIPSTTCFSFRTSSWSFWLPIWRSATQYTSSDVSLKEEVQAFMQNVQQTKPVLKPLTKKNLSLWMNMQKHEKPTILL